MRASEYVLWIALACIVYTYAGYPLLLALAVRLWGRAITPQAAAPRTFSIVIAAYNEAKVIGRRVRELLDLVKSWDDKCEVVVVSDGSTDGTLEAARRVATLDEQHRLVLVQLPHNQGKAAALNAGVAAARERVIVFADARQRWNCETLGRLLAPLADPAVGAVSGDLVLDAGDGALGGVGLYWKIEKWLRQQESRLHSAVGATGAICAVRRELFMPMKPGTILDDVSWPVNVALGGYRVIHEPQAQAFDSLPARPQDEFRRKVRTLSGNFQLLLQQPQVLRPWRNPILFGFISKKLLRLVVPWAMIAALLSSVWLVTQGELPLRWLYVALLAVQLLGYAAGLAALRYPLVASRRIAAAASSLLVLNTAAFCAFWVFALGRSRRSWRKVSYTPQLSESAV